MAAAKDRPLLNPLSILLCKGISSDLRTGQLHLNGIFDVLEADSFPCRFTFCTFVSYSAARGHLGAHFRIVDVEDKLIGQSKLTTMAASDDPLQIQTFFDALTNIEFPDFGSYFVQLWVNERYTMEHRLLIASMNDMEQT